MTLEACIAHAIHADLDILEALPEIHDLPGEELEAYIEHYVLQTQEKMYRVIKERGEGFIKAQDAAGLCATCMDGGVNLPPTILLKMCKTILELSTVEAQFILDTEEGASLYYMKVELAA